VCCDQVRHPQVWEAEDDHKAVNIGPGPVEVVPKRPVDMMEDHLLGLWKVRHLLPLEMAGHLTEQRGQERSLRSPFRLFKRNKGD
jgi:hypothetical protein